MDSKLILGKPLQIWKKEFPVIKDICDFKETSWSNNKKESFSLGISKCQLTEEDVKDAERRLARWAAFIKIAFPETAPMDGIIESPLRAIPNMKKALEEEKISLPGKLLIKLDSHLPISGSIKARGGIYEVLKIAEDIAFDSGMLNEDDNYSIIASQEFRDLFSKYTICVGSTGNLGLSIGIISAKLGFHVTVHMSADARQWKKDMLRDKGVLVMEYDSDYSIAVEEGRKSASNDPYCYFIDDENSKTLFLGYSVAALRLKKQLDEQNILVDKDHPLFVYLPCGVGGGPGGVAFGLKIIFGDDVHCFFAEPTHSPCMILGMATGENNRVSVQDFGVDNRTVADGLAVGRASGFVGELMSPFISGCYTISDERMYHMLTLLADSEDLYLEPSALAGMYGPIQLTQSLEFKKYLETENLLGSFKDGTQLVWATGGSMVPEEEMKKYYQKGKSLKKIYL